MARAVIDQESTEVEVDPILCDEKKLSTIPYAAISHARRKTSLGIVKNILNQEVRLCVFLLGQASRCSALGHDRCTTCALPLMDKLACIQDLSG